jgi:hypothetical protein
MPERVLAKNMSDSALINFTETRNTDRITISRVKNGFSITTESYPRDGIYGEQWVARNAEELSDVVKQIFAP